MKSIKPIALKEAKILSNEEMKHLFGGSGSDSGLTAECNPRVACSFTVGSVSYTGSCSAIVTSTSISCPCVFSSGDLTISGSDSACFKLSL